MNAMRMKKIDGRKLSSADREKVRREVLDLRAGGLTFLEIEKKTGLSKTGAFNICSRAECPDGAVKEGTRGRRKDEQRSLTQQQQAGILGVMCEYVPAELNNPGLPYRVWSRRAVRELIKRAFRQTLEPRTVGKYLAAWGFPTAPSEVKLRWRETITADIFPTRQGHTYGRLLHRLKHQRTSIVLIRTITASPTAHLLKLSPKSAAKLNIILYATAPFGTFYWRVYPGPITHEQLTEFLEGVRHDMKRKIFALCVEPSLPANYEALDVMINDRNQAIRVWQPRAKREK